MPLFWLFVASCLATFATPVLLPSLRLFFFAPFLAIVIYKKPLSTALWIAFICGLLIDLIATHWRFGFFALNFSMTALALYQLKSYFFEDNFSTVPLMTFLFGAVSALLKDMQKVIFQQENAFSWSYFISDVLIMPACDALFAFTMLLIGLALFRKAIYTQI